MMNNSKSTKDEFIKYKRCFVEEYLNEYNQIIEYLGLDNESINKKVVRIFFIKVTYLYFFNVEGIEICNKENRIIKREKKYLDKVFENIESSNKNFFQDYLKDVLSSDFFSETNKLLNVKWDEIGININNDIFFNNNKKSKNYRGKGLIYILNKYRFNIEDNINYEEITPEILGDIYLHIFTEEYRNKNGLIYTSKELVKCMCKYALIHYIEENSDMSIDEISIFINAENILEIDDTICNKIKNRVYVFEKLLEEIRVIDPSSGCGAFIIGMIYEIVEINVKLKNIIGNELSSNELYLLKTNIISNNIYAVDIDAFSNAISLLRMYIYTIQDYCKISEVKLLNIFKHNVIHGSTLDIRKSSINKKYVKLEINGVDLIDEFDIAIGNPPYISYNKILFEKIRRSEFGNKYYYNKMNLYFYFFHKCIEIIREKGLVVFVTPNSYMYNSSAKKLRADIYDKINIKALIKFDKLAKIFEGGKRGIKEETVVSVLQKKTDLYICEFSNSNELNYQTLQNVFDNQSITPGKKSNLINSKIIYNNYVEVNGCLKWIMDETHYEILQKIYKNEDRINLGTICEVVRGIDQDSNIDGKVVINEKQKNKINLNCVDTIKLFGKGEFISNYYIKRKDILFINETTYCNYGKKYDAKIFDRKYKIVNRKDYNKTNKFALDEEKMIWPSSVIVTYIKKEYLEELKKEQRIEEEVAIKFILSILNSKLILFWLFYNSKISEGKLVLENRHVENIPILDLKSVKRRELNQINKEVDSIISILNDNKLCMFDIDIQRNIDKIDSILYKAYKITEEEKQKIDSLLEVIYNENKATIT